MGITRVRISGRLALACRGCGEIILFVGRERDWYESGTDSRPRSSVCSGCGAHLTLADRVIEPWCSILSLGALSATRNTVMLRASMNTMRFRSSEIGS